MSIPQGLLDALNATQAAKDEADAAKATKDAADAAVAAAQATAAGAATDLTAKAATLDQRRTQLDAVIDAYFQVGAPAPTPA